MNKEDAHKRLLQVVDYLKDNGKARNHEEIAQMTSTSRPNVSSAISGNPRYVTEPFLKRFAAAYSDYVNEQWLLTGEGEMAKPEADLRPHIGTKARAGFMDNLSEGDYGRDLRPTIPFFKDYDFTIEVVGDSMEPNYQEGDILACRKVNDRFNPPIGKVCVLDTREGAVVKVIKETTEDGVMCHSFNNSYPDYEIPAGNINQTALVVGSIRIEE